MYESVLYLCMCAWLNVFAFCLSSGGQSFGSDGPVSFGAFHKCSHKSGFCWPRIDFLTFVVRLLPAFFPFPFLVAFLSRILYRISWLVAC